MGRTERLRGMSLSCLVICADAETPVLSPAEETSLISTLRAMAVMPIAADTLLLLVLLQYDNYPW